MNTSETLVAPGADVPPANRWPRLHLPRRIWLGLILALVATGLMAGIGLSVYRLVLSAGEESGRNQLEFGQRAASALLAAEESRLVDLSGQLAGQVELQQGLKDAAAGSLEPYLAAYQSDHRVDILAVENAAGELLTSGVAALFQEVPRRGDQAHYQVLPLAGPQVVMSASRAVVDEQSGKPLGYVTLGTVLDEAFNQELAAEIGTEQSIVLASQRLDGERLSSTLTGANPAIGQATARRLAETDGPVWSELTSGGRQYNTRLEPLTDPDGDVVAWLEVARPASDMSAPALQVLAVLIASWALLIAASFVAGYKLQEQTAAPELTAGPWPEDQSQADTAAAQYLRIDFLATVTHEFRTPLAAMKASVEYLLEEMADLSKEDIRELLGSIHLSVIGLQMLIDNLLESASMEAGRFIVRRQPVDLPEVIDDAVRIMRPLLDRRGQWVVVTWQESPIKVDADGVRLTQVLVNLLSNASKYGPMAQAIDVEVSPASEDQLRVAVADHGSGIPLAERSKLFSRFSRLGKPNGAQYGVGLGLSVVKAIISEHGGQVGVAERPGGGCIFWFTIPCFTGPVLAGAENGHRYRSVTA